MQRFKAGDLVTPVGRWYRWTGTKCTLVRKSRETKFTAWMVEFSISSFSDIKEVPEEDLIPYSVINSPLYKILDE